MMTHKCDTRLTRRGAAMCERKSEYGSRVDNTENNKYVFQASLRSVFTAMSRRCSMVSDFAMERETDYMALK